MQTANRASPHVMLGVLTLLSLGAIVLSLDTSPPNAQSQLRTAAANAAGASSFVLTDTVTSGPPSATATGTSTTRQEAFFAYQAPDKVEETVQAGNQVGNVLWVGKNAYERIGNSKWFPIPGASSATSSTGELAASQLLLPLQALAGSTAVAKQGSTFTFSPAQEGVLLDRLFGTQLPAGTTTYEATVSGEFLSAARVTVLGATERRTVNLTLTRIEHGPALHAPAPSDISTTPLGSG